MSEQPPSREELDAIDRELRGLADEESASTRARMSSALQQQLDAVLEARSEILGETSGRRTTFYLAPFEVGQRLGPFELGDRVGRGAQGEVWRAVDTRSGQVIALKLVPRSRDENDVATRRFQREASLAQRLDHPSLCPVFEAGQLNDHLFLAMRFIDGPSLADRRPTRERRPGPIRIREAVETCAQLADGLAAAHAVGILHRDVKPSNVRVDRDGVPVLVDFGLARDDQAGVSLTGEATIGTPAYMPPEALTTPNGRRAHHDPKSDLWSLGVVLFELTTGERPFDAPTREGLYRAITCDAPTDARRCNPNVTPELVAVLATCLAKDPDQRYRDAGELAADLHRLARGERPIARPPGLLRSTGRWLRRNPLPTAIGLLLVGLLTTSITLLLRAVDAERDAHDSLANERAARRASDGMRLIANARTLADRQPGLSQSLALLGAERCRDASVDDALLHALQQPWDERIWDLESGTVHDVAFSPDGQWLASVCDDGSAHLLATTGDRRIELRSHGATRRCVTFLAADRIASGDDEGQITIWQFESGEAVHFTASATAITALSPAPGRLAIGDGAGMIHLFQLVNDQWTLARQWQGHSESVTSLTWRDDTLTSSGNDGRAVIWPEARDASRRTFSHPMPELGGATLSADGSTLLCASTDNRLWSWNASSGAREFSAAGHRSGLFSVAAHPSGPFALTTSYDRTAILWHTDHGRVVRRFVGHRRPVVSATFAPDGSYIATASADGSVRLWLTHAPKPAQHIQTPGRMISAHFSADGERLIFSGDRGAAGVWSLTDGQRVQSFGVDRPARTIWACPSPDTRTIYSLDNRGRLRAFDTTTGATSHHASIETKVLDMRYSMQCSPGSDQILITDATGNAWLYDSANKRNPIKIRGLANFYNVGRTPRSGFLHDSKRVATVIESGDRSVVMVWDRHSGAQLARHDAGQGVIFSVAVHPKANRLLLGCGRGSVDELDPGTGKRRNLFISDCPITSARYDHRGNRVVAADQQGGIWIWQVGADAVRLQGHESVVYDACFSPDDRSVLSTSWDGSAALWDVATHTHLRTFGNRDGPMLDASFAPTGDYLVTVSVDGLAHTWPCDPLRYVRENHRRSLTTREREELQVEAVDARPVGK